ncbi:MAG: PCMD domain-containing protein [Tannerellaceae bacterium]|nr:PCMD domain-containing protein [Tannerellaceae bacterium]
MGKRRIFSILICAVCLGYLLQGCIKNDLPYPNIQAVIEEMEVDGLAAVATINKNYNTVLLLVDDTIDLRQIRITRMEVTEGTVIIPDNTACENASLFPDSGFVDVDSLPGVVNTNINLRNPANFILRMYEDFPWEITAEHYLNRKYNLREAFQVTDAEGNTIQVGQPRVDEENKNIIIYVDEQADLSNLRVQKMQIGSSIAVTRPEPTTITDFRRPVTFEVTAFDETEVWTVTVTYSLESNLTITPWSRRAYIMGDANENSTIDIRFRRQGDEVWDMVYSDEITFKDGSFTALIRHLQPNTVYEYEGTVGNTVYDLTEFTTDDIPVLPNSGFENWSIANNRVWLIHGADEEMFWDSGNHGSITVEKNVTNYDESVYRSGRRSAKLGSEFVVLKFAAGNILLGNTWRP